MGLRVRIRLALMSVCVILCATGVTGRIVPGSACQQCFLLGDVECTWQMRCPRPTGPFQLFPFPMPIGDEEISVDVIIGTIILEEEYAYAMGQNMCTYCKQIGDNECVQRWCF